MATQTIRIEREKVGDEIIERRTEETPRGQILVTKLRAIIYYVAGIIALAIALRFILVLAGARNVGAANFIYRITDPFVTPFYGIFGGRSIFEVSRIEYESIAAVIAVALIAFLIVGILRLLR